MTKLQKRLIEAGYPKEEMFHHETDLYIYATPLTKKVVDKWCKKKALIENGIVLYLKTKLLVDQCMTVLFSMIKEKIIN